MCLRSSCTATALSFLQHSRWYTPAHIVGGWNYKFRRTEETSANGEKHEVVRVEQPERMVIDAPGRQQERSFKRSCVGPLKPGADLSSLAAHEGRQMEPVFGNLRIENLDRFVNVIW